jgi:gamma-glutamyltranspeptidase / glutathione hydrolase
MSFDSIAAANLSSAVVTGRPVIQGRRQAVASGHYLATMAATRILDGGGNAVDAGVAAGLVQAVVQGEYVNFAGVAPIMIRSTDGPIEVIAGLGHWPKAANVDIFADQHGGHIPEGLLRTVIPAAPDAYITALRRHGTMRFADVAAPAIDLAANGFVMYPLMADLIGSLADAYRTWPQNAAIYLPGGQAPKPGDVFVQRDLARTMQYMADEEGRHGDRLAGLEAARNAFYRGDIAQAMVAYHREHGGWLTAEDLVDFRCDVEAPVTAKVMGMTLHTARPWCQGPALIAAWKVAERLGLKEKGHNTAAYIHHTIEAINRAFNDRERYFSDPRLGKVPLDWLISDARADAQAALIREDRALIDEGLDVLPYRPPHLDTSYVAVCDKDGLMFSAVPSDVSYDTPVIPGWGICPSSRGGQSWGRRGHPCEVRAGIRPRLTPNPVMVETADQIMAIGTPGGDVQVQAVMQVLLNHTVFGMNLQAAIEAPRFASYGFPDSFEPHDYNPGMILLEADLANHREALEAKGHRVTPWPRATFRAGGVCAVARDKGTGVRSAAADFRRPAYAAGW